MITLNKTTKEGARYFQIKIKNTFIRIYARLNKGKYSHCDIYSSKQVHFIAPPSKVFHGEDCLQQALDSYKSKIFKQAIKLVMAEI
jgi:hypothetical protein